MARREPPRSWVTQARKGLLELVVLNDLARAPAEGSALWRRLRAETGLAVAQGTLYALLKRLRRDKYVRAVVTDATSRQVRRRFELTMGGRERVEAMNRYWRQMVQGVSRFLPPVDDDFASHGDAQGKDQETLTSGANPPLESSGGGGIPAIISSVIPPLPRDPAGG